MDFRGVSGDFKVLQKWSSTFQRRYDDFTAFQRFSRFPKYIYYSYGFQEIFGGVPVVSWAFLEVSRAFQGFQRRFQGRSRDFRGAPRVSQSFQGCSCLFQWRYMGFSRGFSAAPGCFRVFQGGFRGFQGVPGVFVFQGVSGSFRRVKNLLQRASSAFGFKKVSGALQVHSRSLSGLQGRIRRFHRYYISGGFKGVPDNFKNFQKRSRSIRTILIGLRGVCDMC